MENKELEQVMNYVRDLGVEMLRSLERGTQATLSLRDTKQVEIGTETNDLLKKLLKLEAPDYSDSFKENTKALKDLSKSHADSSKAVISAIKDIKVNIPPFPEQKAPIIDFKGITTPFKELITAVKEIPKKFGSLLDSFGTKTRPVYVVQVDENGKVITEKEAQTIVHNGGVVRTVSLANKAGVEFNPATEETLDSLVDKLSQFQFDGDGNLLVSSTGVSSGGSGNIDNVSVQLQKIFMFLQRNTTVDPSTGQLRVLIGNASIAVTGTLTGVTTVTNLTQFAGFDIKQTLLYAQDRSAWALNVRSRIV